MDALFADEGFVVLADLVDQLAEAVRTVGLNETSEGGHFMENLGYVMDGQTGWEHAFGELPMYSDGAKFFGQAGATFSPTLVVAGPRVHPRVLGRARCGC